MFLWLTQNDPSTNQPRLLSQYTINDLFAPHGSRVPQLKKRRTLRLVPRMSKTDTTDLDELHQAGPAGVLVDQQRRAVYYSQYVNKTFYDFVRSKFFTPRPGELLVRSS